MHTCSSQNQQIIHLMCQKKIAREAILNSINTIWPTSLSVDSCPVTGSKNVSSLLLHCTATGFLWEYEMIKWDL